MSSDVSEPTADWDCVRKAIAQIRASRGEFRASVFDGLDAIERMGDGLLAYQRSDEREDIDRQMARLTTLTTDLAELLSGHQQMVAEERVNRTRDMHRLRAQIRALEERRAGAIHD